MCGLAGLASTEGTRNETDRRRVFPEALEAASWRGRDSTGVAAVPLNNEKTAAEVYKRAISASDFIQLNRFNRYMANMNQFSLLLGHARSATRATVNDWNAHPFQSEHITLTHNGTIYNTTELDVRPGCEVDSAYIAASMAKHGEKETLSKIRGGYALVWHNAKSGTLNFAVNKEKPLVFCFVDGENTMYWHSELETLYAILTRNRVKIDGKFRAVTPHCWLQFDPKKLREYTKHPFVEAPLPWSGGRDGWHQKFGHQDRASAAPTTPMAQNGTNSTPATPTQSPLIGTSDPSAVATLEEMRKDKNSSIPTSRAKLRKVEAAVSKMGIRLGGLRAIIPESFRPYKNQHGRGAIEGTDHSDKFRYVVPNVTESIWRKVNEHGRIFGRVSNIQYTNGDVRRPVVVLDFNKEQTDKFLLRVSGKSTDHTLTLPDKKKDPTSSVILLSDHRPPKEVATIGDALGDVLEDALRRRIDKNTLLLGPSRGYISRDYFDRLTKDGCSNCTRSIPYEMAPRLSWSGDNPICSDCVDHVNVSVTNKGPST